MGEEIKARYGTYQQIRRVDRIPIPQKTARIVLHGTVVSNLSAAINNQVSISDIALTVPPLK
jgi:hypothetical protein